MAIKKCGCSWRTKLKKWRDENPGAREALFHYAHSLVGRFVAEKHNLVEYRILQEGGTCVSKGRGVLRVSQAFLVHAAVPCGDTILLWDGTKNKKSKLKLRRIDRVSGPLTFTVWMADAKRRAVTDLPVFILE
jgi:hypothetical protein